MEIKKISIGFLASALFFFSNVAVAQPVPRKVVVEYFTNTYCSICASRNPGFYNNLNAQSGILHIAFHPSSPYAACTLNKYNKTENDARTNFYGVYGSTPRLVIQGKVINSGANYADSSIFIAAKNKFSSFQIKMAVQFVKDSVQLRMVIIKRDTSTLLSATIYAGIIEKEINFTSNNGETSHHDVFRRAFFGTSPFPLNLPTVINDSVVITKKIAKDANWNESNIYAIGLLQNAKKEVLQAEAALFALQTNAIHSHSVQPKLVYPNPFTQKIIIAQAELSQSQYCMYDRSGKLVAAGEVLNGEINNLEEIKPGIYYLKLSNSNFNYACILFK